MARTAEALLVGLGLALCALGAAVLQGRSLGDPLAVGAAAAAGAAMGAAWFLDLRPRVERLAREVDRALRLDGALVTAWEAELRAARAAGHPAGRPVSPAVQAPPPALVELLARGVCERVRRADAVRAALPRSAPILAVPFLAAALLAWAVDRHAASLPGPHLDPVLGRAVEELDAAERAAQAELAQGRMRAEDLRELAALRRAARELQVAGAAGAQPGEERPGELDQRLAELGRRLDDLLRERVRDPLVARALERVATCVDAARAGLEHEGMRRSGEPGPPAASAGTRPEPGAGRDAHPGPGPPGASPLANGAGDGTMSAPAGGATRANEPERADPAAAPGAGEAPRTGERAGGVAFDLRWPERHAGLVARWVEARRAAADSGDLDSGAKGKD